MDFEPNKAASTSAANSVQSATPASSASHTDRALRSSARLRGTSNKETENLAEHATTEGIPTRSSKTRGNASASSHKRSNDNGTGKGKAREVPSDRASKRTRRATAAVTASSLIINEPVRDPKGKKRAAPEYNSEDELQASFSKRLRSSTSSYSLRPRKAMPKKPRTSSTNTKSALKAKIMAAPGPSRLGEDKEMMDVDVAGETHDHEDEHEEVDSDHENGEGGDGHDEEMHDDDDEDTGGAGDVDDDERARAMDERAAISMFSDFSRIGGYLSQLNARLKTLLGNIKSTADPTTRLIALQELSELLSISTEDTLAGSFQVEEFVRELVRILGGTGGAAADDEGDDDDDEPDEDAALAAALAMSSGGAYAGDENLEAQLLACRCLANLMEALPGCGHTLVYHGAIPVLCSKLLEISYIDLAEQTLITLEKISEEYPSAIVREGGLAALLNFLDFFSIAVQRTALQAAANCCRNASLDSFPMIKEVWPIIRNCLGYADQRLVDFASLCVIRTIDSYYRAHADKLESLVDANLIRAINMLLLPSGGSSIVPANTYTLLIHSMATAARSSAPIAVALLEADVVTTLYQILTGVLPPSADAVVSREQGGAEGGQGLGGGLADMAVMQNLAHRPKDQIEEALTLISELMPPLPKDGTFDHKGYSEKALHRMIKAKTKADRVAARVVQSGGNAEPSASSSTVPSRADTPVNGASGSAPTEEDVATPADTPNVEAANEMPEVQPATAIPTPKDGVVDRSELLRSKLGVVNHFMNLMAPILVDVYAASVSVPVRIKSLTGLLKAICFLESEQLVGVLKFVPIASFISSILSSKDHPTLMIGVLQMVELLLSKAASEYKPSFRREGVLHEIELLSMRALPLKGKEKETGKDGDATTEQPDTPVPVPVGTGGSAAKRMHLLDPEDAYTLRARVIRFKYLTNEAQSEGDSTYDTLRHLVNTLRPDSVSLDEMRGALHELAGLFASPHTSVSSFELLQSGLVDALLNFSTSEDGTVDRKRRQRLLIEELVPRTKGLMSTSSPLAVLVKKLQESLTRMESFEVFTVTPGVEDSKRSSPSLLARQIRLRLVAAEGTDTPRSCNNIVVSIHAIATFQALHDYLRPRLSGLLSTLSGARLSGVLAALSAGRLPLGAALEAAGQPSSSISAAVPSKTEAPSASTSTEDSKPERRRSLRLRKKASASSTKGEAAGDMPAPAGPPPSTSSTLVGVPFIQPGVREDGGREMAPSETAVNDEDDFMDADVDAEVLDDDMENDDPTAEKTVTLSVVADGSKVEAQTPDGTRIATPNPLRDAALGSTSAASSSPPKTSYASALRAKPVDWHLEFSMDDHVLPLDMTIYGAVHQHELRKTTGSPMPLNLIWQGIYTVQYKKVPGPPTTSEAGRSTDDVLSRARSPLPTMSSITDEAPHSKILRLLRVLHKLNVQVSDSEVSGRQQGVPETAFVNNKLTAKLTRQLEEPMIVASSCLPDWAMDLPVHFPFLFPFATRFSFLQSTSFGYARLILKWQSQQGRAHDSSRRDDSFGFLGRLQRQKVRISRKHILESAFKVFELYGSSSSILEVEYFDEVGTGLGPTLEFYSLVSREFARRDLKIWRDADSTYPGPYVHRPNGLFPAPLSAADIVNDGDQKRTHVFRVIGQFVAKAMLDSRIVDMTFNKIFLKHVLGEEVPLTLASLRLVDAELANSLSKLQSYVSGDSSNCRKQEPTVSQKEIVEIEDLALDFTVPGYDIELRPDGQNILVTSANVHEYIDEVIDVIVGKGVALQAKAFRDGFSKVFPVADLQAFSSDELMLIFGGAEEDWCLETLNEAMKADHGFNVESRAIRDLMEIMTGYDTLTRRDFLQFITGSPKLPIGGFRGLNPPLTVVRKPFETPLTADDYLPSVMTCVNYLKLPEYSTKDVMREKLKVAMQEGVGSFHLS